MKFGKSLSHKVREEWRDYAVNYKAMKKALPEKDTYSSVSDDSKFEKVTHHPRFWEIYRDSQDAITQFYTDKKTWAYEASSALRSRVEKYRLSKLPGSILTSPDNGDELRQRITRYTSEVQFLREFLSINYTAFSKILKKYDKRTCSDVRETKLQELLVTHQFLDGGGMDEFLDKATELFKDVDGIDGIQRRPSTSSSVTTTNSATNEGLASHHLPPISRTTKRPNTAVVQAESSGKIAKAAQSILAKIDKSPFFTKNKSRQNPTFKEKEIEKGDILGEGEFSIVREVNAFHVDALCPICMIHCLDKPESMASSDFTSQINDRDERTSNNDEIKLTDSMRMNIYEKGIKRRGSDHGKIEKFALSIAAGEFMDIDMESFQDDHEDEDNENIASRGFMKHHCFRQGSARYAIKQLKKSLKGCKRSDGAIDLSIEAKFLSVLSHTNIVKLCGTGGKRGHPGAFIILDRLYDTLDIRIQKWRLEEKKNSGFMNKNKCAKQVLFNDRLLASYDIARAMKYLHSHDIIFRDLKPENIGFDVRGSAKIFDFGLAKELVDKDKVATDQYRASGRTGTRRYMAPEVVLCKHYGKPADVFSFAVLFWEILSLNQPFKGYDYEKHAKTVVMKKKRPEVKKDWPAIIQIVMKDGWDDNPAKRPSFDQICDSLSGQFLSDDGLSRSERLLALETSEHLRRGSYE